MTSVLTGRARGLALLSVLAAGCGGHGAGGAAATAAPVTSQLPPPPASPPTTVALRGTAHYEKLGVDLTAQQRVPAGDVPVREVRVEALVNGSVVAAAATRHDGSFELSLPAAHERSDVTVRLLAQSARPGFPLLVRDGVASVTTHALSAHVGQQRSGVDLLAPAHGVGGAFNVLEQCRLGRELVQSVEPAAPFPPLTVVWAPGATQVTRYEREVDKVFLDGDVDKNDALDDSVVLRQFGLYLQDHLSHLSAIGGFPGHPWLPLEIDPRKTYQEALATALGQLVLGTSTYVDVVAPSRALVVDLEAGSAQVDGLGGLEATQALIWDLLDGASAQLPDRDQDGFAIPFSDFWRALRRIRGPHVYLPHLHEVLSRAGLVTDAAWNRAFLPSRLHVPFPNGTRGLGFELVPNASPTLDGVSLQAPVISTAMRASRLYYVELTAPGPLTVGVSCYTGAELDLQLVGPDERRVTDTRNGGTSQVRLASAAPGLYLVRVYARGAQAATLAQYYINAVLR